MTTELDALVAAGAVRSTAVPEPTAASNVDTAKLEAYARLAIQAFVPSLSEQPMVPGQLALFDFSERKQSNAAALVVGAKAFAAVLPRASYPSFASGPWRLMASLSAADTAASTGQVGKI